MKQGQRCIVSIAAAIGRRALLPCVLLVAACSSDTAAPTPIPVTAIRFATQPTAASTGEPFAVSVELLGEDGAIATTARDQVTLTLDGDGALTGQGTVAATRGVATFNGVSISGAEANVVLKAAAAGFTTSTDVFRVSCGFVPLSFPSTVNGSLASASCISRDRSTAVYRFSPNAIGAAQFALTSAFAGMLEVRTVPAADNVIIGACGAGCITHAGANASPLEWLLLPGTYELRVASTGATGTFSLASAQVAGNTGCRARQVIKAGTYTGQRLAGGDCDFGDGSPYDEFVIYGPGHCGVTVRDAEFTPFVWIYNPQGELLDGRAGFDPGEEVSWGGGCQVLGSPLRIWINSDVGEPGGTYTLVVIIVPPAASASAALQQLPGAVPSQASDLEALLKRRPSARRSIGR